MANPHKRVPKLENDCIFATKISSNMETINVRINITTPTGRRLLREMEKHPKTAIVEYPLPEIKPEQKTYTIEESYEECCKILSDHYKVDVRKL